LIEKEKEMEKLLGKNFFEKMLSTIHNSLNAFVHAHVFAEYSMSNSICFEKGN
jgi:hypothetical protein